MTPEDFAPLEISRYELRLRAEEACTLPPFLGSTLRGAFGHALKEAVFAMDNRDCHGCDAADPCAYHYLFETPVPPDVAQLRGQREAPVPFILSPPIVQNPVRRVWRVPAADAASAAAPSLGHDSRFTGGSQSSIRDSQSSSSLSGSAGLGGFASNSSNPQSSILEPQSSSSLSGSAGLGGFARNETANPQSAIRNSQSPITSVVFPDQPRRFAAGDILSFDLVLIGRGIECLRYVVLAVDVMARRGLGANRARFELKEVWLRGSSNRQPAERERDEGKASCQLASEVSKSPTANNEPMERELIYATGVQVSPQPGVKAETPLAVETLRPVERPPPVETSRPVEVSRPVEASPRIGRSRPLSELIRERLAELKVLPQPENSSGTASLEDTIAGALSELQLGGGSGSNGGNATGLKSSGDQAFPHSSVVSDTTHSSSVEPSTLRLRFVTPTRIRVRGDLQTELSFELLVRNLLRRVSTLSAVHGRGAMDLDYRGLIERAKSVTTQRSGLRWWDLERFTSRQGGKLKVGGFIGEVEYEGEAIKEFLPLLVAGELMSIGTGTSFGLGRYRILECANTPHGSVGKSAC